ncbi:M10 family metallopeptidase C-terminal domain-containing protein [Methylobacterium trifolii]|uniref:M10 family metallopeptidase C-terminal domain-containing protein n=1 Tax=Methylobacterium trifolii TaxID=1003092 RepID=UPI001EDF233D|nr:M10 family metallopeptidase C-terminal domain-containing protein [Methylobacterium trifolii]
MTEASYLSGLDNTGAVVGTSYWRDINANVRKWEETTGAQVATGRSPGGTVQYYFNPASAWTQAERGAFESSMALWSSVADIQFAATTTRNDADFVIERSSDGSASAGGPTTGVGPGQVSRIAGDSVNGRNQILIDTSVPSFSQLDSFDRIGGYGSLTIIHELGHTIGLGHAGNYNGSVSLASQQNGVFDTRLWTVMSYINPNDTAARNYGSYPVAGTDWGASADGYVRVANSLMPLDIIAAQQLYGVATNTPLSGGQVFGFNTNIAPSIRRFFDFTVNQTPVVTLYDTGRNNALDLSGYGTASTIDLRDGHFSSAAGITNNIGIAFGTVIETGIGGGGADLIQGNTYDNVLQGNLGADTLTGGAGNDVFRDTAANHDGDRITDFTNADVINVSDATLLLTGLQYGNDTLSFTSGGTTATMALQGTFSGPVAQRVNPAGGVDIYFVGVVPVVPAYGIAVSPPTVAEGNTGPGNTLTYTVTRTGTATAATVAVGLSGTATGPGSAGADYSVSGLVTTGAGGVGSAAAPAGGSLGFAIGQASASFTVTTTPDTAVEPNETVIATLGTPTDGGTVAVGTATGTILDDDAPAAPVYTIAVGPASGPEDGDATPRVAPAAAGAGTTFTYTVTRTGDVSQAGSAAVALSGTATRGGDYTVSGLDNGAVGFAAGATSASFTVTSLPDTVFEPDETVTATLGALTGGGSLGGTTGATATIRNDDAAPVLSLGPANVGHAEGTGGGTRYGFTVTRSGDAQAAQTVSYAVSGGGVAGLAAADAADFTGATLPTGSVSFAQGETSQTFFVLVAGDAAAEPDEGFTVTLSGPNFGTIGTSTATGTITNDDSVAPPPPPRPPTEVGPTPFDDDLIGTDASDEISLLSGDDRYSGLAGDDTVFGNAGNDAIQGNEGADLLLGNQGDDTLFGGQGADTLYGGQNRDVLFGNLGTDVLLGNLGADTLFGGQGADTLYGGQGNDVLSGDLGDDVLTGGSGADRYVFDPASGHDVILGFAQAEGDRIDLRGQSYSFGTAADGSGSALLVLSGGGTIELAGITQAQVNAGFFA